MTHSVPAAALTRGYLCSQFLIYLFYCGKWASNTCLYLMQSIDLVLFVIRCVRRTRSTATTSGAETHSGPNWNQ